MNWKLFLGSFFSQLQQLLIRSNRKIIINNFPYGRDWIYDLKRGLKDVSVIVDAGAHVGSVAIGLNYWFPDAEVYAFEPVKATYEILQKGVFAKSKVHPINMGLGSTLEKREMLLSSENSINSLKITQKYDGNIGTEEIMLTRLDDFLAKNGKTHIDILKIDVEGFEFEVLAGCGSLLADHIKCIYLEVGYSREPTKVYAADVDLFMEENGFELCGIYETRRNVFDKRRLWYANNLYIKKSLLAIT